MEVHVNRNTGPLGGLSSIKVNVNGEAQGKLKNNDVFIAAAPEDTAEITVNQSFFYSNSLTVNDGDQVEVTLNKKYSPLFVVGLLGIILGGLTKAILFHAVGLICLLIVLTIGAKNWFIIKKR
ncbi:hypothetical protein MKY30_10300 [Oceanobacillus sp. FSL W8-0428]|uniref:Uncharacterized protein n=1 Tax=Oceanobacillus sojae TaxID=582851 RepID=A0A511ZJZ4_9BACI|nr:hypothetical protein [Oceanobacillus sojae]GEN87777.1 hypothetical protein OSO01_25160 [Oceanobacillus sojae]